MTPKIMKDNKENLSWSPKITREIERVIYHCSDTPQGADYTAQDINRWHINRGWECIGYHFVIRISGIIEFGRSVNYVGAHCKGQNLGSIGICYIGRTEPSIPQKEATADLYRLFKKELNIDAYNWFCHNQFNPEKTCPGFKVDKLHDILSSYIIKKI